jgi:hypothetical protein
MEARLGEARDTIAALQGALGKAKAIAKSRTEKGSFHVFVETKEENQRLQSRVSEVMTQRPTD